MNAISRRQWSAAGLGLLASRARGAAHFTHPLGAELYTVRNVMPTAADQTLKSIAEIGYREVETDRGTLLQIAPLLKKYGLKPVSCHIETPLITGNWKPWVAMAAQRKTPYASGGSTLQQAMEDLKKHGVEYMVMAYLLPQERGDLDYFKQMADKMNSAGAQAHAAGLKFCYHNHCFEFRGEHGQRPIDILLEPDADSAAAFSGGDWPTALGILRDAGSRINQLGPETSLAEALQLIAETAVRSP